MNTYNNWNLQYIGGEWREGNSTTIYENKNPYNDEIVSTIKLASKDDVQEAYAAAQKAQPSWESINAFQKAEVFEKAVAIMKARREEICELLIKETGSTYAKASVELDFCISITREAASFPLQMGAEMVPSLIPGKENRVDRRPVGVVGVISPFNFPMYLSMRSVAPALAAGNSVVLKPDEQTCISGGLLLAKIFEEAGLPKGLLHVVIASISEIEDSFTENPIPRVISFTGSTPAGIHIAQICARTMKKAALELGGNNPLLVLEDADIERAVRSAIYGKFFHNGQICMAINRILVHERIYQTFVDNFVEAAKKIKVGDPRDHSNMIGPLINRKSVERIMATIAKAKEEGAQVVLEGHVDGNVMSPFILTSNTNNVATAQHEMFGPVVTIIPFKTEQEGIAIANDSPYGLSAAVHAGSIEKGVQVAKQIVSGMVHVNDQSVNDEPLIAFGGEKMSGLGRFGGKWSLEEFTTLQWISTQNEPREYPF
ncbi:aldehyde dehydrogenase family protein [Paenibacillus arenosi]|uniref:Aldehyde dehydrogenase family protein n=1 Tax=Paenibacillus arenosi TaxID=2774142 RepID=A0ABR9AYA9_9BACL|nr:aldehyde dehydrogenase family protein [Paenibacillus arenosi]MBD8499002.1 aldehyde dehydrogenase family protein [Paenibacillus arenosi]